MRKKYLFIVFIIFMNSCNQISSNNSIPYTNISRNSLVEKEDNLSLYFPDIIKGYMSIYHFGKSSKQVEPTPPCHPKCTVTMLHSYFKLMITDINHEKIKINITNTGIFELNKYLFWNNLLRLIIINYIEKISSNTNLSSSEVNESIKKIDSIKWKVSEKEEYIDLVDGKYKVRKILGYISRDVKINFWISKELGIVKFELFDYKINDNKKYEYYTIIDRIEKLPPSDPIIINP